MARDRLNPGGLFAQWIHAYRLSKLDFLMVLRTFYDVFRGGSVWEVDPGHDYVLLGARESKPFSFTTLHARLAACLLELGRRERRCRPASRRWSSIRSTRRR